MKVNDNLMAILKNTHRLYNLDHNNIEFDTFIEMILVKGLVLLENNGDRQWQKT